MKYEIQQILYYGAIIRIIKRFNSILNIESINNYNGIKILDCGDNNITFLPELPKK